MNSYGIADDCPFCDYHRAHGYRMCGYCGKRFAANKSACVEGSSPPQPTPKSDYVRRDAVIALAHKAVDENGKPVYVIDPDDVMGLPAADVVQAKRANWIEVDDDFVRCSRCGLESFQRSNICDSCQSLMDGFLEVAP